MECQAHRIFHGCIFIHYPNLYFHEGRTEHEEFHNTDVVNNNCIDTNILEVALVVYLY